MRSPPPAASLRTRYTLQSEFETTENLLLRQVLHVYRVLTIPNARLPKRFPIAINYLIRLSKSPDCAIYHTSLGLRAIHVAFLLSAPYSKVVKTTHSHFSWKTTSICSALALSMLVAAGWQWSRHEWKVGLIQELTGNLEKPVVRLETLQSELPESELLTKDAWDKFLFRRVEISGTYDFSKEVVVKNRRLGNFAGFHVITPLKLDGSDRYIIVNRGFIPLGTEARNYRANFHHPQRDSFTGLIKEGVTPKFFSPSDGVPGIERPWIDAWLRVDLKKMQEQLPFTILPIYLEKIGASSSKEILGDIVKESEAGRNEILMYTSDKRVHNQGPVATSDPTFDNSQFPVPAHDTTPPPDIHLGYVFEWSFMALLTAAIGIILQLPRPSSWNSRRPPQA